jgi:hypothetical protein
MFDAPLVEPPGYLGKGCAGDVEGNMMEIADAFRVGDGVNLASFIGKDGNQAAIARIKIKVAFVGLSRLGCRRQREIGSERLPKNQS